MIWADRQASRHTQRDTETDKQKETHREKERERGRQRDKEKKTETHRETDREGQKYCIHRLHQPASHDTLLSFIVGHSKARACMHVPLALASDVY